MPVKQLKPADFSGRDLLKLAYISVDDLALLDGNPKLHDKQTIQASIIENGFRDPPTWDANLNNGQGGIVEGNGRSQVLKTMQDSGSDLPRGLAQTKEGKWVSPVIFGCDARSEAAARRYAIDHNNITMTGGGFGAAEIGQMYNPELLMDLLKGLNDEDCLPLTVSEKDLNLLLSEVQDSPPASTSAGVERAESSLPPFNSPTGSNPASEQQENAETNSQGGSGNQEVDEPDSPPIATVRMLQLFLNTETYPEIIQIIQDLNPVFSTDNPTDLIVEVLRSRHTLLLAETVET